MYPYQIVERETGEVVVETDNYNLAEKFIQLDKETCTSVYRDWNEICWNSSISGKRDLYELAKQIRDGYSPFCSRYYIQNGAR